MSTTITLKGTFIKEYFRNYNGFATFSLEIADFAKMKRMYPDLRGKITCKGVIPDYVEGTPLYIEGNLTESQYGLNVEITKCIEKCFNLETTASFLRKLCAELDFGKAITIASFVNDIFSFSRQPNAANVLSIRTGVPKRICSSICDAIQEICLHKEVLDFLSTYKVSQDVCYKISKYYGKKALEMVRCDPFEVGCKCDLKLDVCEKIAQDYNLDTTKSKLKFQINQCMIKESEKGHVFTTFSELLNYKELNVADEKNVRSILETEDDFVIDRTNGIEALYLSELYNDEIGTASEILRLERRSKPLPYTDNIVNIISDEIQMTYAPQQAEAFNLIKRSGVKIITGGPGTGKTTCVNGVIRAFELLNPDKTIRLCAPSGRAAQRMAESTGREAVTIHRLLEIKANGISMTHKTAENPIDADLIVVDEASMIDISLAHLFLAAVKSGATVLFIGDINQLPSVGAGDFLNSIISSNQLEMVQLTTVYRQSTQSAIVRNANAINRGETCLVEAPDYTTVVCNDSNAILREVVVKTLMSYDKRAPFDSQVLCTARKCPAGVFEINKKLQQIVNPPSPEKEEYKYGNKLFRLGDKVIMTRNNYSAGYYNGDIGIIKAINRKEIVVETADRTLNVGIFNLQDMLLAYAITIHKSQGSEFKNAIVVLPKDPFNMLQRNLLYTAVTRAKKTVHVLSEGDATDCAISRVYKGTRNTLLSSRLTRISSNRLQNIGENNIYFRKYVREA